MEKLERTLEGVSVVSNEPTRQESGRGNLYRSLTLIEDKAYQGPTSIKYWM